MTKYAENTSVSSEGSRAEIERNLTRFGADSFLYGWEGTKAMVMFRYNGKQLKFTLDLPDRNSAEFTHTPARGTKRSDKVQEKAYEQAVKQKWRSLSLLIKAQLVAVEDGIKVFEEAFFGNIMLPDGQTVSEHMIPQIEEVYATGKMPPLLTM